MSASTADSLSARIGADPWSLVLRGIAGDGALREDGGLGSTSLGTLGFEDAVGWHHATRVVSSSAAGDGAELTLATNDPLGRTLEVSVEPDREGVIRLRATVRGAPGATATGIGFGAAPTSASSASASAPTPSISAATRSRTTSPTAPTSRTERPIIDLFVPP